jgi:diguanylate cyclase (GGDEF)-like protein
MPSVANLVQVGDWSRTHREQLAGLARATPAAMAGYAINTTIAVWAFYTAIPNFELLFWAATSYVVSGVVGWRALRARPQKPSSANSPWRRTAMPWVLAVLLALPWSILTARYAGILDSESEIILIALAVGMAASGSVLLAPIPSAAILYMSALLLPLIFKSVLVLGGKTYLVLGLLGVSYWFFLAALIATTARLFAQRLKATTELERSLAELSKAHEETELAAMTDGLTGLPNRRAFVDRLEASGSAAGAQNYGLLYLDLDRFKDANDALGHHIGDDLLRDVGGQIQRMLRGSDFVARIGGDEFAIFLENVTDRSVAESLSRRLRACLSKPFIIDGHSIEIGASIGVALSAECGLVGAELLKQADLAMYEAKASRLGVCFFDPQMQQRAEEKHEVETGLRTAIARGELVLHYQPICRLFSDVVVGCEALVRWERSDGTIRQPDEFLPVAESIGLTDDIGQWVIREACQQALKWPEHLSVSVNLAPSQIMSREVVPQVARVLRETGLEPRRLQIEITETSLLKNTSDVAEIAGNLKSLGLSIALDDFGTGYSSLSHLVSLPFDRIKIDRLFVSQLGKTGKNEMVIKAIVQLARGLGADVVAEGIETDDQLLRLRSCGVALGQGYFLSKPLSVLEATRWIEHSIMARREERSA